MNQRTCMRCKRIYEPRAEIPSGYCEACLNTMENQQSKTYQSPPQDLSLAPLPQFHQQGWVCPKCGQGIAPWMPYCNCNVTAFSHAGGTK